MGNGGHARQDLVLDGRHGAVVSPVKVVRKIVRWENRGLVLVARAPEGVPRPETEVPLLELFIRKVGELRDPVDCGGV